MARQVDQPQGQNSSQEPMGLSRRDSFKKGCSWLGLRSTSWEAIFRFRIGAKNADLCCVSSNCFLGNVLL